MTGSCVTAIPRTFAIVLTKPPTSVLATPPPEETIPVFTAL